MQADSLAASATALAFANLQYLFRLGEKVKHKIFGMSIQILNKIQNI